jgi:hypothetical protein
MKILEVIALTDHNGGMPQPTTFWHVTPHTRLKSIFEKGLLPSRRRQWSNHVGGRLGETKMIYLFSDFDSAINLAARLEWGLKSGNRKVPQVDILEIRGNIPVTPDDNIEAQLAGGGKWWKTRYAIPPQMIVNVIPLTLPMTRDYIARRDRPATNPTPETMGQTEINPEEVPDLPRRVA